MSHALKGKLLPWKEYFRLKKNVKNAERTLGIIGGGTALISSSYYFGAVADFDPVEKVFGMIDPQVAFPIATLAIGSMGWMFGKVLGGSIWRLCQNRHVLKCIDAMDTDFYHRIQHHRPKNINTSLQIVPDYYGEKINSVQDYRSWLKKQKEWHRDWLTKQAPPNYVAGLGRGANGFTTRSDIGPAREQEATPGLPAAPEAPLPLPEKDNKDDGEDDDERFQDPDNETGLFNSLPYDDDDNEADSIYKQIDDAMDERRRARREEREKEELQRFRKERPKIQSQFSDLKRQLGDMTSEDWANIPEVGDLVRKKGKSNKNNKNNDRFTPVPDSVLLSAQRQNQQYANTIDANAGVDTPMDGTTTSTDFAEFGQARDKVLSLKLDQIKDSVSSSTVDPKGYLTDLNSVIIKTDAEISDIKKARSLLRSVILTNPKHAPGWIAAARLEEVAGKIVQARELIAKGCEECTKSEDIWLEAARLNTLENARIILANAVRSLPQSVNIWIKAAELESETNRKKQVTRRALEFIPNSVKIWKAAISLEDDPEDAKVLLSRATECVPLSIELWLALAKLETYQNARRILNKARGINQTSHEIWIAAARLEEKHGDPDKVDMIIKTGVKTLVGLGSKLDREQWIKEAENCEKNDSLITCQAIIKATIGIGVENEDRESTWMEDAESCAKRQMFATARAIYAFAISNFPKEESVWMQAAFFERAHGTRESLETILQKAVQNCPHAETLWLMGAKEKWLSGDINGARGILEEAYSANQSSEDIWLAVIKLEVETGNFKEGREFLEKAREKTNSRKVWMKSAMLERQLGNFDVALKLLDEALVKFPSFEKLWMIKGQIQDIELNDLASARQTYANAVKQCPRCITLWILSSRLEEKAGVLIKGRAILEKSRLINKNEPELWLEAIHLELRGKHPSMAKALLAKALQDCPNSGKLWAEAILLEARVQRKAKATDAIRGREEDPYIILTIARLFWAERKIDKARSWFQRAVKSDPNIGDHWAWYIKFEIQHGDDQKRKAALEQFKNADPKHGEKWQAVRKDLKNFGQTLEKSLDIVVGMLDDKLGN
ncbi:hypothetical protein HK099_001323 [Clydaea vesicula]|uniref:Pre-mRNA-processing factor 6 n=1 Tax=Clydaea vesicula TaxID=447962 RepID=A0AAD5U549_9FUNG|nr:hypothetical protein HK099_001323 [Clydaea vesicula]